MLGWRRLLRFAVTASGASDSSLGERRVSPLTLSLAGERWKRVRAGAEFAVRLVTSLEKVILQKSQSSVPRFELM